jgi:hypothetical protein
MSGSDGHRVLRTASRVALGAAFAGLLAIPATAAWDGTQAIRLGDSASAEFVDGTAGAESHYFSFFVPETTKVSAKTSGKGLKLRVDLVDIGGAVVDVGTAGKGTQIKPFQLASRGDYGFRVQTTEAGSVGVHKLTTKATWPKQFNGPSVVGSTVGTTTFEFGAAAGSTITAQVKKAKGSTAAPVISKISGPAGDLPNITAGAKQNKVPIAADGKYRLTITNTGGTAAGDVIDVKVSYKPPKGKRTWAFGGIDAPKGTQEQIRELWLGSAHNAVNTEAFRHWDADIPAVISTSCAKCHSTTGYRDQLGVDGSTIGKVDKSVPVGETVQCEACHNDATATLTEVEFESTRTDPAVIGSGVIIKELGDESRCMVCHQGRESKVTIDRYITNAVVANDDEVDGTSSDGDPAISFRNIHYFAAAATLFGRDAGVGYEYPEMGYERKFTHVEAYNTCIECHEPHTLKVKVEECADCHTILPGNLDDFEAAIEDLHKTRMAGTIADFDGDGDADEGIYEELDGMGAVLYKAIQEYAKDVVTKPIIYEGHSHPYFFEDKGTIGVFEPGVDTNFTSWSARLVKAAFNYQMWQKDPGAFAHNGKYIMELMYDSIANLNEHALVDVSKANGYPADFASLVRNDSGHFDTSAEQFRHWDEEEEVSASCARCHSIGGLQFRHKYGIDTTLAQEPVSGLSCETCHVEGADFNPPVGQAPAVRYFKSVTWPSLVNAPNTTNNGPEGTTTDDNSFVCIQCHQGRESTATLDSRIASNSFGFRNVHYFPSGGTVFGNVAKVAYQYSTASAAYNGKWDHKDPGTGLGPTDGQRCMFCHGDEHSFEVQTTGPNKNCASCHGGTDVSVYRAGLGLFGVDLDGVPATTKLGDELAVFTDRMYKAMREYTVVKGLPMIRYDGASYPYFFTDDNDNGILDGADRSYNKFDAPLLKAAFNYQYAQKEPGMWAHNTRYSFQIIWESVRDLATAGPLVTNTLTTPTVLTRP